MSRASLGFAGFGSWTNQASNFLLTTHWALVNAWRKRGLGYSCEWLAESALQIMMVLQETDLPPPALLGLQLSHYMDLFSSGHRRVLMHENYVQTNHAKTRLSLMFFFVRHHDLLKQRAILGFNNKPRDRIKGTYLLSESVRWYPSKDLIDTNFQVIFQFSAVCDVGSWYVVLEKHWHLHFSMLSLLCSSDWHTNHTKTKTKGNQKKQEKEKDLLSQSVSLWLLFLFVWFRFCVVYCLLEYIYIYIHVYIFI